ncbi:Oxoglutarate/iron-dependent oxygenase [Niveomyces insectorum RCEF 264]|uniref:Oxoglutarate/iron-dependent oxygenase n=1 Tax=Niveomyces insectorum RCEF 264 TaxID=1081102 RepID=A0A167SIQ0_9HYPO|nr:Oxoglutarate/iron-dependent oxygenase [Niveomyces insectorum RCEF 264]
MAPSAISPEPEAEYVEFSHDGYWGHKREVLRGARAKPTFEELPIIDISGSFSDDFDVRLKVAKDIANACEKVGFFYIVNHGISQELLDGTMGAARKYFEKPLDEKMKEHIYKSKDLRGYEPVHGANVDPRTKGDRKESFLHNYEPECDPVPPKMTDEQRALLHQNLWPENDTEFKKACYKYDSHMVVLMRKMMQMFALGLGLDEHHFDKKVTHPLASCKMIHYPPQDPSVNDETGIGAHTDFVCFTMLLQDDVGGLEVLNANAHWVPATPVKGAFVVNVGDFLMRLTNRKFLSTVHRVTNKSGRERYSMPWFCSFNLDAIVEVLPDYVTEEQAAAYEPITVAEYYKRRLTKQRNIAIMKKKFVGEDVAEA